MTLGILSSVGLGSGLHTFVLYLAPHILRVCSAALQLGTTDFSARIATYATAPRDWSVQGLSEAISPQYASDAWTPSAPLRGGAGSVPTLGALWAKVAWPAFLWGVGTAIGELPPYFIARAAARAGQALGELEEARALAEARQLRQASGGGGGGGAGAARPAVAPAAAPPAPAAAPGKGGLVERAKVTIFLGIHRYGFWAILLAASIPNPLFDLAGLTCGHVGTSFATFFTATLLGKSVVKAALLQAGSTVALLLYGPGLLRAAEGWLPGFALQRLRRLLDCHPSLKFSPGAHCSAGEDGGSSDGSGSGGQAAAEWVKYLWGWLLVGMVGWLLLSIVESVAQEQLLRDAQRLMEEGSSSSSSSSSSSAGGAAGGAGTAPPLQPPPSAGRAGSASASASAASPGPAQPSSSPGRSRTRSPIIRGTLASLLVNREDLRGSAGVVLLDSRADRGRGGSGGGGGAAAKAAGKPRRGRSAGARY